MDNEISDEEIECVAAALHDHDRRNGDTNYWNDSPRNRAIYLGRAHVAMKAYFRATEIDADTIITIRKVDR